MKTNSLSEKKSKSLAGILRRISEECDVEAVVICNIGGYVLAQELRNPNQDIANAAALSAAAFAATKELAQIIGEPGFKSIFHRGEKSGILIQALDVEHLIMVVLGPKSIEGLVRLFLKKVSRQIESVLVEVENEDVTNSSSLQNFEVTEKEQVSSDTEIQPDVQAKSSD